MKDVVATVAIDPELAKQGSIGSTKTSENTCPPWSTDLGLYFRQKSRDLTGDSRIFIKQLDASQRLVFRKYSLTAYSRLDALKSLAKKFPDAPIYVRRTLYERFRLKGIKDMLRPRSATEWINLAQDLQID